MIMKCANCGHDLTTGAGFCGNCGTAISAPIPLAPSPTQHTPAPPYPHSHQVEPPAPSPTPAPTPYAPQGPQAPQQQPYGQPAQQQPVSQQQAPGMQPVYIHPSSKYNEMAIISAVLLLFFPPISVILGFISLSQIKQSHERGRGLAITGIILGALSVIFFVLFIALAIATAPESYETTPSY